MVTVLCRTKKIGAVWGRPQHSARVGDCRQRTHLLQLQSPGVLLSLTLGHAQPRNSKPATLQLHLHALLGWSSCQLNFHMQHSSVACACCLETTGMCSICSALCSLNMVSIFHNSRANLCSLNMVSILQNSRANQISSYCKANYVATPVTSTVACSP